MARPQPHPPQVRLLPFPHPLLVVGWVSGGWVQAAHLQQARPRPLDCRLQSLRLRPLKMQATRITP